MAEMSNSKRVIFPKGKQTRLINKILLEITVGQAAELCGLSERTIRDWRREKFSMDLVALYKLCQRCNVPIPKNIEPKDRYWYIKKGCSAGGIAVYKKYGRIGGNPEYRKKKWYEWWEREGKYNHPLIKWVNPISKPDYSEDLAEFVGIVLGDGSISKSQITVTLNRNDDKEYGKFFTRLVKSLFNVPVGVCQEKKAMADNYVISRSELVRFCINKLGLVRGDKIKQKVDIPGWVKKNKLYSIACVRGLVDTDGCVFLHRYKVNKKTYQYKKLCFTSYSKPLRSSVFNILKKNGLSPRMAANRDVRLDSVADIEKYFQIFGFHNPKHLRRYKIKSCSLEE